MGRLRLALIVAFLLGLSQSPWHDRAHAEAAKKNSVVVSVDGVTITDQDITNALSDRGVKRSFDLSDNRQLRAVVLKDLILEAIAKKLVNETDITKNPALARDLETLRNQRLLKFYFDKSAQPKQPTVDDVKNFTTGHSEFFQDRKIYHYSELTIEAQTPTVQAAVKDRIQRLAERKAPDPQSVLMLTDWLDKSHILYGHNRAWQATEQVPDNVRKTVIALDGQPTKVNVETKGQLFRVLALYESRPNPLDPMFAQNDIYGSLLQQSRKTQVDAVTNDMLKRAKIVLYDPSFKDLKLPLSTTPLKGGQSIMRRIYLGWNFAMLVLAPTALYLFFRREPPTPQRRRRRAKSEPLLDHIAVRIAIVAAMGALLLWPTVKALHAGYLNEGLKVLLSTAAAGAGLGIVTVYACTKVEVLRDYLSSRWLALIVLAAIQFTAVLTVE